MTDTEIQDLYEGFLMRDANTHAEALRAVFDAGRSEAIIEMHEAGIRLLCK